MSQPVRTAVNDQRPEDILTLADAAAYLRVPEAAVLKLAIDGSIPAQNIGGEWRFLREALKDWIGHGSHPLWKAWPFPSEYILKSSLMKDWLRYLEERIQNKIKNETAPRPGSKEAVLKYFGVFKDDDDLEDQLADARVRREAWE